MAEPSRTPGKAEGTEEQTAGSISKPTSASATGKLAREPNRTPGKAEGTVEDAQQALKQQERKKH